MGIDIQALKILRFARDKCGSFKRTLTIGRQGIHCPKHAVNMILECDYEVQAYCESLFSKHLGSTTVDSIDASSYEKATIIFDLNNPIDFSIEKFDTIFDGGCLEHIYNIPQALYNLSSLCKIGGQILHILPTNNQCGHGFWQISPELFFTLYSEKNGYKDTEVFLGDTTDPNWTYKIAPPPHGKRHDIQHPNPLYVMVRTTLVTENFNHKNIQQSDYVYEWKKNE